MKEMHLLIVALIVLLWLIILVLLVKKCEPTLYDHMSQRLLSNRSVTQEQYEQAEDQIWLDMLLRKCGAAMKRELLQHYETRCYCIANNKKRGVLKISNHFETSSRAIQVLQSQFTRMPKGTGHFIYVPKGKVCEVTLDTPIYHLLCLNGRSIDVNGCETISAGQASFVGRNVSHLTLSNFDTQDALFLIF